MGTPVARIYAAAGRRFSAEHGGFYLSSPPKLKSKSMYQSQHNNTGIKQREIICPAPAVTRHKEESKRVNDRLAHLQLSDPHDGTVD